MSSATLSVRRPSLLNRTLSTPPLTPTSPNMESSFPQHAKVSTLTPPISPTSMKHSRSSSDLTNLDELLSISDHRTPVRIQQDGQVDDPPDYSEQRTEDGILCCPFEVDPVKDARGRDQLFGTGAWSTVYKATPSRPATASIGLLTPPSSPVAAMPIVVAVKKPARPDAKAILRNEAVILSYLNDLPESRQYIVPFFGISGVSLVLGAYSLSLDEHIRRCAAEASQTTTTANMHLPVLGSERKWLDLAHSLISALLWLHESADVVHGDIKPGNILLNPRHTEPMTLSKSNANTFPYQPLLIDFSSSHRTNTTTSDGAVPLGTLSALTREYTAPELLKSSVLRDPSSTATKSSDVFSLAITLLVSAIGNPMVYDGSVFQRQYMATQGWQALDFVRYGRNGTRVPRFGMVERVVERAVLKWDLGRVDAGRWLEFIETIAAGEPSKS